MQIKFKLKDVKGIIDDNPDHVYIQLSPPLFYTSTRNGVEGQVISPGEGEFESPSLSLPDLATFLQHSKHKRFLYAKVDGDKLLLGFRLLK